MGFLVAKGTVVTSIIIATKHLALFTIFTLAALLGGRKELLAHFTYRSNYLLAFITQENSGCSVDPWSPSAKLQVTKLLPNFFRTGYIP